MSDDLGDFIEEEGGHIINEPFLTDEGFVNPACMNELEQTIADMPPTYIRCSNDPEWSTAQFTHYKEITASLAFWSVKQLQHVNMPPNLEKVIGYVDACVKKQFDKEGWGYVSLCDISKMLYENLGGLEIFEAWNTEECLGDDWLDLDALITNVCILIRTDRREFDRFNYKFDQDNHGFEVGDGI